MKIDDLITTTFLKVRIVPYKIKGVIFD